MRSTDREGQVESLAAAVEAFRHEIGAIAEARLDEPLGNWTPRAIVGHLIGWNGGIVEGCRQLLRGELPFYDHDPGEDYSRINELFVREHALGDRAALLGALRDSADDLGRFLESLEGDDWGRESGVMHGTEMLTVRDTVDDLIDDYRHHTTQIRTWVKD